MLKQFILFIIVIVFISGCSFQGQSNNIEITVSAASSLSNSMNEIKTLFENDNPEIHITFNYGSSGSLEKQITLGAPVDLFFSADVEYMDRLLEDNLLLNNEYMPLLSNELVIISNNPNIKSIHDMKSENVKRISIGQPETVPVGKYAKQSLVSFSLWEAIEERLVYAKDARQVLSYVENNHVDAGIVFKTDAISSSKVHIVSTIPREHNQSIIYPIGILSETKHKKEAMHFLQFLQETRARDVFTKYGFIESSPNEK